MGMKSLIQSKTFWVNLLTFMVGAIALFNDSFIQFLTPEFSAGLLSLLGVLGMVLRFLTTKEIKSVI